MRCVVCWSFGSTVVSMWIRWFLAIVQHSKRSCWCSARYLPHCTKCALLVECMRHRPSPSTVMALRFSLCACSDKVWSAFIWASSLCFSSWALLLSIVLIDDRLSSLVCTADSSA